MNNYVKIDQNSADERSENPEKRMGFSQAKVLIIDDDPAMLRALPELIRLQLNGLEVKTSNSPREGLAQVEATDYDAIVSDIKMPGMDGLTLLSKIRSLRPNTPILLMTSYDD